MVFVSALPGSITSWAPRIIHLGENKKRAFPSQSRVLHTDLCQNCHTVEASAAPKTECYLGGASPKSDKSLQVRVRKRILLSELFDCYANVFVMQMYPCYANIPQF